MGELTEFKPAMDFTAKTFAGMEEILALELRALGAENVEIIKRGCTFKGDIALMYKVNYLSRLAIRILKPVGVFEVVDDVQLYNKVKNIDWMNIFKLNQTFSVDANLFHSDLDHSQYAALRAKDAIVDQFRDATGKRPWVNTDNPHIYIDVHISHNVCTISLDSSGESLHKRGYKVGVDKAPINEVLAAGMIALSGWKGDCDFYDPMCGSGTIPIEAAMLAMNIPAGYYRKEFAFMNWDDFDSEKWTEVKQSADDKLKDLECDIYASDRSEKAMGIAKRNFKNAGLHKDIIPKLSYFDEIEPKQNKGIIITNPPYGIRLEEKGELRDLYRGIGDVLKKNFSGFEAWIISPNWDSAKFIGLRPSKRITLFNGPVETKYMKFEIYDGTRRYGDSDKPDWKDDNKPDLSGKRERVRKRDFSDKRERPEKRRSDNNKDKDFNKDKYRSRFSEDKKPDENENRRDAINKRSLDFERRMESLRRFSKKDEAATRKKGTRKRISRNKPNDNNQSDS